MLKKRLQLQGPAMERGLYSSKPRGTGIRMLNLLLAPPEPCCDHDLGPE